MPWGIMLVPVVICTSVIPGVYTDFASVGNDIFQLRPVDRSTILGELPAEVRIVVGARLIQSGHISVATAALAVGLGVVGIEVIAAPEGALAPGHPADMGLLFGVALHMPLQMFMPLESPFATGLLALELDLANDMGQGIQRHFLAGRLLASNLP